MTEQRKTLGELEADFMKDLTKPRAKVKTVDDRSSISQELRRFVRWFGPERTVAEIRPDELERFSEEVQRTALGAANKLQPVRDMLAFAKKKGYTSDSLSTHVRIRRTLKSGSRGGTVVEQQQIPMTREGHSSLKTELNSLVVRRPEMAQQIALARADGDLRENGPYHAAKDSQGQMEARIREIEATLKYAVVVDESKQKGEKVTIGRTVIVRDLDEKEDVRFTLVGSSEADIKSGRISTASPTGRALVDRVVGDEFEVTAPAGTIHYRVLHIE